MALPAAMALSGINEDYFSDGLNDLYRSGALLLRSPNLAQDIWAHPPHPGRPSSISSSSTTSGESSGFSSLGSEPDVPVARNLGSYFDLLFMTENIRLTEVSLHRSFGGRPSAAPRAQPGPKPITIMYQRRNLLDLGSNMKMDWNFRAAEFKMGSQFFFKNRSQYSRILNADPPEHDVEACSDKDCSYEEYTYK